MWDRFPNKMRQVVFRALDRAGRDGRDVATAADLLLAVLGDAKAAGTFVVEHAGGSAARVVRKFGVNGVVASAASPRAARLGADTLHLLDVAVGESRKLGHKHTSTEHVVLAALVAKTDVAGVLAAEGVTYEKARAGLDAWMAMGKAGVPVRARRRKVAEAVRSAVGSAVRWPKLAHAVFVRHSLAHPRFVTNPYPLYAKLRAREPVRRDPVLPAWVLTRHADCALVLKDPRFRRDMFGIDQLPEAAREQLRAPAEEGAEGMFSSQMLFMDPPRHTRVRGLFAKAFTPASLSALRPRIEQIANKRIDRVVGSGRMDVIAELAYPLPVIVIAELLGFPAEDYEDIKRWSDDFAATLSPNPKPHQLARSAQSLSEIGGYFDKVVAGQRRNPRDTLLGRLLEAEIDGEKLAYGDLFANCVLLLAAGHETTTNLIGNGLLALLRNREQLELLVKEPELAAGAVEELLRYDAPVQWSSRIAAEEVGVGGVTIPGGDVVLTGLGAANRDPAVFKDAERLDIRRGDASKHLAFGGGIHFCLGATLARYEAEIALRAVVTRLRNLRLGARKLTWQKGLIFRGVKALPVAFEV